MDGADDSCHLIRATLSPWKQGKNLVVFVGAGRRRRRRPFKLSLLLVQGALEPRRVKADVKKGHEMGQLVCKFSAVSNEQLVFKMILSCSHCVRTYVRTRVYAL